MTEKTFDTGWNDALGGFYQPPLFPLSPTDQADYKLGWQQGRAELLISLQEKQRKNAFPGLHGPSGE